MKAPAWPLAIALLVTWITWPLAAVDYCVRAGATGTNNGADWNNAYPSLPATLQRGARYYIAGGNYTAYNCDDLEASSAVITIKRATQQTHGVDAGWQPSYGDGQAVFGSIRIMTDNWVIDGVVGGGPGNWTGGHGFRVNGSIEVNPTWNTIHPWIPGVDNGGDNVALRHIEIVGSANPNSNDDAVSAAFTNGLSMSYLHTRNTDNCPLQTLNVTGVVWEYCYVGFFAASTPEVHGEIMSADGGGDYIIRWNLFRWVASTGGLIFDNRHTPNLGLQVYGNVFYRAAGETWSYGPSEGLIGNWTGKPDNKFHNVRVCNNTFINVPQVALGSLGTMSVQNVEARNNYFYNTGTGLPNDRWSHDYDHYQDSGTESEANGTQGGGNPFVTLNVGSIDFAKLTSNTSAADAGVPAQYRTDWFGNVGTTRGAIQFGAASGNTAPTIADVANQTTNEDSAKSITVTVGDAQTAAGSLTVTATSSNATLVPNTDLVVTGSTASRLLTITPAANRSGSATITMTVTDAGGLAATDTFVLTVTAVNDAPTLATAIPDRTAMVGSSFSYGLPSGTFTDADGDALVWTATGLPAWLSFSASTRTFSGTPITPGSSIITVTVRDAANASVSDSFSIQVTASTSLPVGWSAHDVGAVAVAGTTTESAGTWTLRGSGADIWGSTDEFRFAHRVLSGDGEITARVQSLTGGTNTWAKVGLMIRDGTAANARHAMIVVTRGNGVAFQRRPVASGSSSHTSGRRVAAPCWLRLTRSGSTITGSESADGKTWTVVGSTVIALPTDVRIGLCVTSHQDGTLCTAIFSDLTIIAAPASNG